MLKQKRYLCLTVDICENTFDQDNRWTYLKQVKSIRMQFMSIFQNLKITWFIRADLSIKNEFGSITHLLKMPVWKDFEKKGDEIGWHSHYYKKNNDCDLQENDITKILNETKLCLTQAKRIFNIVSSRMGRLYSHNLLIKQLKELGIKIDSNCLPKRKSIEENMSFDWSISPFEPFYPSEQDYRRSVKEDESNVDILEVPYSTMLIKTDYDEKAYRRYLNISFHSNFIKNNLEQITSLNPVVMIFHPFEIIDFGQSHSLISFSVNEAIKNLKMLVAHFEGEGFEVEFITLKELLEINELEYS